MPPGFLTALMPTARRNRAGQNDGEAVAPGSERTKERSIGALPARLVELGDREMMVGRTKLPVPRTRRRGAVHRRQARNRVTGIFRAARCWRARFALWIKVRQQQSRIDIVGRLRKTFAGRTPPADVPMLTAERFLASFYSLPRLRGTDSRSSSVIYGPPGLGRKVALRTVLPRGAALVTLTPEGHSRARSMADYGSACGPQPTLLPAPTLSLYSMHNVD